MAAVQNKRQRRSLTRAPTLNIDEVDEMIVACRMQQLDASCFHNATLLKTLADQHVANFKKLLPDTKRHDDKSALGERTWGSLCSGSEGAHFVMDAVNYTLAASGQNPAASGQEPLFAASGKNPNTLQFRQVFACEIQASKRKWIDAVVNDERRAHDQPLICIFCDIRCMGGTVAECSVHNRKCIVPDCDILIVSTSCKDLSKLSNAKFAEPVLSLQKSPGGSADTFRGLLSYLDGHHAGMLVYENSDQLDDQPNETPASAGQRSNSDIFVSELSSRGMEGQAFVLNSNLFGLPQSRPRFWAVYFNVVGSNLIDFSERSVSDVFRTLRLLVQVCQRLPPSAESILLCDSDPHVSLELARRTSMERDAQPFSWVDEHKKFCDQLRIGVDATPPCKAASQSPWFKTLTRKQQSTLTIHQYTMLSSTVGASSKERKNSAAPAKKTQMNVADYFTKQGSSGSTASGQTAGLKFMIDLNPSPGRVSASTKDGRNADVILAPCIVPGQLLWLHRGSASQRLLLGREAMLLQGWPISFLGSTDVTNSSLHDLAGNAMSPPVLLAVALSMIYAVSWKSEKCDSGGQEPSNDADVNEALELFKNSAALGQK
jgi:site-specific DNA-cytosine methylase